MRQHLREARFELLRKLHRPLPSLRDSVYHSLSPALPCRAFICRRFAAGLSESQRLFRLLIQLPRLYAKSDNCPHPTYVNRLDLAASFPGLHLDCFLRHGLSSVQSRDGPIPYRSISPSTISMLPIAATTSAMSRPSHMVG